MSALCLLVVLSFSTTARADETETSEAIPEEVPPRADATSPTEISTNPSLPDQDSAAQVLQQARSHYERGDFAQAAKDFASVLDSPVKLRSRQDLHEGFLYYSFTLLLQGEPHSSTAAAKLYYALRLDPDYLPSPVTTRPDILAFYNRQRDAYIAANGPISEPPEIVFPELQSGGTSTRVLRRRWFVPAFGIGLRFLGHRKAANFMMSTEIAALGLNLTSLLVRVALIEDLSPGGFAATQVGRYANYISFSVFWVALITDVVVSLALRSSYEKHPERRPSSRKKDLARRHQRKPRIALSPQGLALEFW